MAGAGGGGPLRIRGKRKKAAARRAQPRATTRLRSAPHPHRHQRRPANERVGRAGSAGSALGGGAAGGEREVEGGVHLMDGCSNQFSLWLLFALLSAGFSSCPTSSSSTPPFSLFFDPPHSLPPLCGQIAAGKRRGPKRRARVET